MPSLLEEGSSQESNGKNSSRDLWPSYERENVSQENPKDGVLLEYDRDRLCGLCEKLA